MDQEKNFNEEVTETVAEAVEQVEEVVEQVEETVEEIAQEVRPEVFDDFSEEFEEVEQVVEKVVKAKNPLVLTTIISSAISVVVTLCVLFLINAVPSWIYSAQLQGVWEFSGLYTVVDGKDFTVILNDPQSQTPQYVEFTYAVEENGVVKIADKDDSMGGMMAQNLFGTNKVEIEIGDDTITFLGMTWNKVNKETATQVKADVEENRKKAAEPQETIDITSDAEVPEATEEAPVETTEE